MQKKILNFAIPLLSTFIAIFYILSLQFYSKSLRYDYKSEIMGSYDYPRFISSILIICALGYIFFLFKSKTTKEMNFKNVRLELKKIINTMMFLTICYVIGITYIGFYISTLLIVFLITWLIEDWSKKKILSSAVFSLALTIGLYFLFNIISIYLPDTLLF